MGEALLVGSLADEGIVDIRQGYDLGGNRDLISHQSVRVPAAIVPLMMPAADLIGNMDQRFPSL